jgi:hypothetical protein
MSTQQDGGSASLLGGEGPTPEAPRSIGRSHARTGFSLNPDVQCYPIRGLQTGSDPAAEAVPEDKPQYRHNELYPLGCTRATDSPVRQKSVSAVLPWPV